ncbi:hypothetical protein ACJX0J_040852, partial [Zea mays]
MYMIGLIFVLSFIILHMDASMEKCYPNIGYIVPQQFGIEWVKNLFNIKPIDPTFGTEHAKVKENYFFSHFKGFFTVYIKTYHNYLHHITYFFFKKCDKDKNHSRYLIDLYISVKSIILQEDDTIDNYKNEVNIFIKVNNQIALCFSKEQPIQQKYRQIVSKKHLDGWLYLAADKQKSNLPMEGKYQIDLSNMGATALCINAIDFLMKFQRTLSVAARHREDVILHDPIKTT